MSYDFMQDAIEALDKSGDCYLLLYGRADTKVTDITSNIETKEEFDRMQFAFDEHREKYEEKE